MGISKILSYDSIQITFDLQEQVALQIDHITVFIVTTVVIMAMIS